MSVETVANQVLLFRKKIMEKRTRKLSRNNLLLQRGRFSLKEEWDKKREERSKNLKFISEKLYPEKYK